MNKKCYPKILEDKRKDTKITTIEIRYFEFCWKI